MRPLDEKNLANPVGGVVLFCGSGIGGTGGFGLDVVGGIAEPPLAIFIPLFSYC
jgi:hypothetical protein